MRISRAVKDRLIPRKAGDAIRNLSTTDQIKFGDKDMRSMLAEEKIRVVDEYLGGGYSRDQIVDMLNTPGAQSGPLADAFNADQRMNAIFTLANQGVWDRSASVSDRFIGEGQFGRVSEFAPGYVIKEQPSLIEWGGYQESTDGSSNLGNLVGSIYDYRDVQREVDQLNTLNKKGITPKVDNFTVNPDGSTEMIMRDLRINHETGDDFVDRITKQYDNAKTPKEAAQLLLKGRTFEVQRNQQQAAAALSGIDLQDRHLGNVMVNKMTGRPLQIDPSGAPVEGPSRDAAVAQYAVNGMRSAGIHEEADIFEGLIFDAVGRGDYDAIHDLAQQGASRLMKIKKPVLDAPYVGKRF